MIRHKYALLAEPEQERVAAWAYKTAVICKYTAGITHPLEESAERRGFFYRTRALPASTEVWVAAYSGAEMGTRFVVHRGVGTEERTFDWATMVIGYLVLQVVGSPHPEMQLFRGFDHERYTSRLHPRSRRLLLWPPKRTLSEQALEDFTQQYVKRAERVRLPWAAKGTGVT
jgi:hypothetical protein